MREKQVSWRVITREADGVQGLWSSFRNRYEAVVFACDALQSGVEVLRIEGPDGVAIAAKAIAELCGPMRLNA